MDDDTKRTIVLVAVFGALAAAIMIIRLVLRQVRGQNFNLSDYLTIAAIFLVVLRSILTTIVVLWQNNNVPASYRLNHVFSVEEIYQREIGSKLTLANRVFYNTYIWIQKSVVLLLYKRMLNGLRWPSQIMNVYWITLLVTFLVAQICTFVDCQPLYLYWQVVPDPGSCSKAPIQLFVFVSLNIVTDIMLIVLPMPWLMKMKRSLKERLQLVGLFSIGLLLIAIAFVRLPINWGNGTTQVNRNTWGSVELFAAAFVANVPTLFALRRRESPTRSVEISHSHHHTDVTGFRQVNDHAITVTNSIELRHESVEGTKGLPHFREVWDMDKKTSEESLVHINPYKS